MSLLGDVGLNIFFGATQPPPYPPSPPLLFIPANSCASVGWPSEYDNLATMSSLSEDISFRVRLVLDTSDYNAALISYKNKTLDVLKLQSARDTSGITSSNNEEELVDLSSKVASFITYFIRKVYVGSNLITNSSSCSISSRRLDRETDLNHFKILIQSYAPELEEACLVYNVVGDANSFAEIRRGFRNAEAASNSTVKIVLCENESDDHLPIMPNGMDTNTVGSGEVIDFVLSLKYGYRPGVSKLMPMEIDTEEESQEVNEESEEGSEEENFEEEGSEGVSQEENEVLDNDEVDIDEEKDGEEPQAVNEEVESDKVDDDKEGSEKEDSDVVVSEEENAEIGNDNNNELESADGNQSTEAGSTIIYPSE